MRDSLGLVVMIHFYKGVLRTSLILFPWNDGTGNRMSVHKSSIEVNRHIEANWLFTGTYVCLSCECIWRILQKLRGFEVLALSSLGNHLLVKTSINDEIGHHFLRGSTAFKQSECLNIKYSGLAQNSLETLYVHFPPQLLPNPLRPAFSTLFFVQDSHICSLLWPLLNSHVPP